MKSTQKGFNLALCLIVLNVNCTHQSITKQIPVRNYAVYSELPLNAIKPNGWLRHFLQNQNSGLTRFLNDVYPNNVGAWSQPKLDSLRKPNPITWPFEQTAYLTDGQLSCGYLLNDTSLITMALKKINYTLDHPDSTGYMGSAQIRDKRWPHSVFFRALKNYYQVSKDKKVLLIVELKKGRVSDTVVGQIQRYMGFVKEELAEEGQVVKGVIIGSEDDLRIRRALSVTTNIEFFKYPSCFY